MQHLSCTSQPVIANLTLGLMSVVNEFRTLKLKLMRFKKDYKATNLHDSSTSDTQKLYQ